ncbi:hypothetical protein IVB46_05980 [Bradyrhizobium sp. 61]|uniref:hypothetical protein n=1 Tax=unclassified Bradyrhizobium TaxID=2631580 RepID=UPI001FF8280A|nr:MULTISPECIES: hypothetical protein [unclassified Bradyrhizobium]MCK1274782.1 hypothetical protein [Bradyrhizobium sp. 61]MCK1448973.1 hypothetical protein [Bradyrhizobium sp. 48]MCK1457494.1 hypothetical protein [Bradyrhizobium sp. 2]
MRREKRREAREKGLRRRQAFGISTDVRNRGMQAFWAMHVEAMSWSGMGVREYAAGSKPCWNSIADLLWRRLCTIGRITPRLHRELGAFWASSDRAKLRHADGGSMIS